MILDFYLGWLSTGRAVSSLQVFDTVLDSRQVCDNGHCSRSCSGDNRVLRQQANDSLT